MVEVSFCCIAVHSLPREKSSAPSSFALWNIGIKNWRLETKQYSTLQLDLLLKTEFGSQNINGTPENPPADSDQALHQALPGDMWVFPYGITICTQNKHLFFNLEGATIKHWSVRHSTTEAWPKHGGEDHSTPNNRCLQGRYCISPSCMREITSAVSCE